MLEAEFDRTIVSFRQMSDVWTQLASKVDAPGSAAYAHRKAIMYQGLEEDCVQAYTAVRKTTGHGISGLELDSGIGWDNGMGWDGMGWDGMGWDRCSEMSARET